MPKLLITAPDGRQSSVELGRKRVKFGRADWCDVVLRNDAEVSREHAEVWMEDDGRIYVEDMHSKNGTRVDNGEAFKGARRSVQHSIRIGDHELRLQDAMLLPPAPPEDVTFIADGAAGVNDTQFFPSTRKLDLNQQRLSLLIQLTERIGGVFERKQLLEQALDACCDALGFERGLIALKTPRGSPELPVSRNVPRDESGAFKVSRTLINRALVDGQRAIVNNPATDWPGASLTESLVRFPICSALCVPILNREEILGVIYGDRVTQAATYQAEDVDFLAAIAQQVGVGLANLRLFEDHLQSQKMRAELRHARVIQQQLLPQAAYERNGLMIEGFNEPSSGVSGDYFDYFDADDGRVGIIIADVTGHGLPAALLMANVQAAIRVALTHDMTMPELAQRVNRLVCQNTAAHVFITAVMGVVDPATGVLRFISAGHPPPILVGRAVEELAHYENSLPLGVEAEETFRECEVDLRAAGAVLFYTDGLTEAADRDGDMLGLAPVLRSLSQQREAHPARLIQAARAAVRQHLDGVPNRDDMTLLGVSYSSAAR